MAKLFQPANFGQLQLQHRVVMSPLTRMRSPEYFPGPLLPEYYQQRASRGGLLISEATCISLQGAGALDVPGIWNDEQVQEWKKVTDAVHSKGGYIFLQLWHMGRLSHVDVNGITPVAPSAIAYKGVLRTRKGKKDYGTPVALSIAGIQDVIEQYRQGAINAIQANFDGVEIHGANGYLIDQFLNDNSNLRDDEYGGSVENRTRFMVQVVDAVTKAVGSQKVGIRLSPGSGLQGMNDSNPIATWSNALQRLNEYNLAYVHLVEPHRAEGNKSTIINFFLPTWRQVYKGNIITAGGHDRQSGINLVAAGLADGVAYGRWFISNPDLPYRLYHNIPLTPYNLATFYGGSHVGYTDYPFAKSHL